MASKQTINKPQSNRVRLVVASSVMLTFISFWRAAAIVLNDLGSSAFYAGGIAEEAVGKSAPWLILGVVCFSFAKLSVSALMFDYILTGPISGVSAGQYMVGLQNQLAAIIVHHHWLPYRLAPQLPVNATSAVFAAAVTIYYWWQNTKGIEESSDKALKVMQITTVMVVILLGWGLYSVLHIVAALPPLPTPRNLHFSSDSLGFLRH